jgi:hypothetical protein
MFSGKVVGLKAMGSVHLFSTLKFKKNFSLARRTCAELSRIVGKSLTNPPQSRLLQNGYL